ncbi:MAG: FAD-dependent oxidoreductase, partial [Candidatus Nanopelagicales bacterium]
MRITVVGAGVMGLSAARVLAQRGHDVICIDQFGIGNAMASSPGATRIWRLAHPDRRRVRLARWNSELWQRLEEQAGRSLRLHRGLLWRGGDAAEVQASLAAEGVEHEVLNKADQDKKFPEMRWAPDRLMVWQPEAGVVLAAETLQASAELFAQAGGRLVQQTVTSITPIASGGVRVNAEGGATDTDCVVVAAGPWASSFLQQLGVEVRLRPVIEQVTYVRGGAGPWQQRPCVIDVPEGGGSFGCYAMPTPGVGYKIGVDEPISAFDPTSTDRKPDANRERVAVEWVSANLPGLDATPVRSEVCSWTDSPDGQFILDRVGDV